MNRSKYSRIPENLIKFDEQSGIKGGRIPGHNKLTIRERLFLYIEKDNKENGCWNWTGNFDTAGRPFFGIKNHCYNVSRVIYAMYHSYFDPVQEVHNVCGNKKCVNPNHYTTEDLQSLFFKDFRENPFYNAEHGIFITWKEFQKIKRDIIRKIYEGGKKRITQGELGDIFDLDYSTVNHIIKKDCNYGEK
jgi:hypothetical protein